MKNFDALVPKRLKRCVIFTTMKKVVCFDFDNVIIDTSLAIKLLILGDKFKEFAAGIDVIFHNTEPKKFFRSIRNIIRLAKGYDIDYLRKIILSIDMTPGTKETFSKLRKKGYKIVIASINDKNLIRDYLKSRGLHADHIYASELVVKNGKLTGEIKGDIIKTEKVGVVKKIEKLYQVKRENITYIGDGLTDLPIMKITGRSILFCPNALTKAEVFASKEFDKMGKEGRFFIVEKKDMREVARLI